MRALACNIRALSRNPRLSWRRRQFFRDSNRSREAVNPPHLREPLTQSPSFSSSLLLLLLLLLLFLLLLLDLDLFCWYSSESFSLSTNTAHLISRVGRCLQCSRSLFSSPPSHLFQPLFCVSDRVHYCRDHQRAVFVVQSPSSFYE